MPGIIIDVSDDITADLPKLKAAGVTAVGCYMSSIDPKGAKCLTPARAKAIAAAGMKVFLVHEGWGGTQGGRGISAADGVRDGKYSRITAPTLGAPKGACIYFAVDWDMTPDQIKSIVVAYFSAVRAAFSDGFYRVGVYGSGETCGTLAGLKLVDLTWLAGSKGWTNYSEWKAKAAIVQTVDTDVAGVPGDSDVGKGDIGAFVPFWRPPVIVPPIPLPPTPAPSGFQKFIDAILALFGSK